MNEKYSNHDLAELADWAAEQEEGAANPDWKDVYKKLKEAADALLRRRARSTQESVVEKIKLVPVFPKPDGGTVTVPFPYYPPVTVPNTGTPYQFPGSEIICWFPTCSHGNVSIT